MPSLFVIDHKLDIVAICETWLRHDDQVVIGDITPPGYSLKHVSRSSSKRGGGVALLYKTGFDVRFTDLGFTPNYFEFLSAEFISSTVSLSLIILYRPQQKSTGCSFSDFLHEFTLLIDIAFMNPKPLIVV